MAEKENLFSLRTILMLAVFIVLVPFLPLLISGRWDWWEAWVYAVVYILTFILSRALAARHSPDILAERSKFMDHNDTQPWDKVLVLLLGLGGALLPLVVGLEARFGQQPRFSLPLELASLLLFLAGMLLSSLALIENSYFSGTVRLQSERGQQVISSGPYAFMRHPSYSGALLTYLTTPLLLDSVWGFVAVAFLLVVLVVRTRLEDRFLQDNLPGYREYAARVRYRLIPGIW